jgi:hypothetical protein
MPPLPGIQYKTGTTELGGGGTSPTINSTTLGQQPSINYTTPTQTPIYPVGGLNSIDPLAPTDQENKASDLSTQLQDLNNQLLGESQQRGQLEQQAGLPELQKTQTDLSSRLTALKNEALAIPLQLQQEATGRGVTAGGLQPIQTAALRNNAIQALSTSSLLEASRGNLTLAQDLVDRAVAQKFDPIRERIDAAQKNLQLILNDPKTSLQDRNRAAQQKAIQDAKSAQLAKTEATELAKGKAVLEYAGIADARTLRDMQNAPDAVAVLQIAAQKGLVTPEQAKAKLNEELVRSQIAENQAQISNLNSQIQERNNAPGGVPTLTGKPQNASQSSANGYADRLNQSNIIIDSIGGNFTGNFAIGGSLPNIFQSGDRQSYEQAKRNFVTAVLRRESGAAISDSEFATEALKYFPQAGDKPDTVTQKAAARNTAINNVYREANVARPVLPGMIIESDGKRYRVGSDGETLEEI